MSRAGVALVAVAVSILSITAGDARAESRSWAVARNVLPGGDYYLVGINVAAVRKHAVFKTVYPALVAMADAKDGFEQIRARCAIDVVAVVPDALALIDYHDSGVFVVSVRGVTRDRMHACLAKLFPAEIKIRKVDKIDEYWFGDDEAAAPKLYVAWLAADVLAMTTDPTDRAYLERMIGGGGAVARMPGLDKLNTGAPFWTVVPKGEQLAPGLDMTSAYATVALPGGDIVATIGLTMASAKQASDGLVQTKQELATLQSSGALPPALASVIKKVKLGTRAGTDLTLRASLTPQEVMTLINLALSL